MQRFIRKWISVIILVVILLIVFGTLISVNFSTPEGSEETLVTNLALNFPQYSTSSSWVTSYHFNYTSQILEDAYTMPVWHHPPLPIILLIPFVHMTTNVYILRFIPILLFLISIVLIYLSIKRTTRGVSYCIIPFIIFMDLYKGASYLYHDAFMTFFFALSWYLIVKGSKWKYATVVALVVSKTPACLLLIPLMLKDKNWKLGLSILTLVPWYAAGVVENGSAIWLFHNWAPMQSFAYAHMGDLFSSTKNFFLVLASQGAFFYTILMLPVFAVFKKAYAEISLLLIALLLFYGWACITYQALPMLLALPLCMAVYVDKVPGFLKRVRNSLESQKV